MGNRAAVIFEGDPAYGERISPVIALHWNGGPESIYPFLDELERRRCLDGDASQMAARFAHVVGDYFDKDWATCDSLRIRSAPRNLFPSLLRKVEDGSEDNGVFIVKKTKDCVHVRRFFRGRFLSTQEVQEEREQARQHDYATTIPETFLRIRPKVADY